MLSAFVLVRALGPDRLPLIEPESEIGLRHVNVLGRKADEVHFDA